MNTKRQQFFKAIYPALIWLSRLTKKNSENFTVAKKINAPILFYSLSFKLINDVDFSFNTLKGKIVIIVNTASNCGYTNQYHELQQLYSNNKDKLIIIGFPANDFKQQENGTEESIELFCKKNYGVSFLMMKKSSVVKGDNQNKIFDWLSDATKNGWNNQAPTWNFCKYIINENGELTHFFGAAISPLGIEINKAINS